MKTKGVGGKKVKEGKMGKRKTTLKRLKKPL